VAMTAATAASPANWRIEPLRTLGEA
jgi:hypothetical protein